MVETEDKNAVHDEVVLEAIEQAPWIADQLGLILQCPQLWLYGKLKGQPRLHIELEYEIENVGFVDLAVFWDDELTFMMEIKSKREPQTASGWTRQVRKYEKAAKVPTVLVIAHDLGDVQEKYLKAADIHVLDLRTLRAAGG